MSISTVAILLNLMDVNNGRLCDVEAVEAIDHGSGAESMFTIECEPFSEKFDLVRPFVESNNDTTVPAYRCSAAYL